ncbi:MAG: hypothetical protein WAV41_05060 [Microgenomates group bacterium]
MKLQVFAEVFFIPRQGSFAEFCIGNRVTKRSLLSRISVAPEGLISAIVGEDEVRMRLNPELIDGKLTFRGDVEKHKIDRKLMFVVIGSDTGSCSFKSGTTRYTFVAG